MKPCGFISINKFCVVKNIDCIGSHLKIFLQLRRRSWKLASILQISSRGESDMPVTDSNGDFLCVVLNKKQLMLQRECALLKHSSEQKMKIFQHVTWDCFPDIVQKHLSSLTAFRNILIWQESFYWQESLFWFQSTESECHSLEWVWCYL